MKKKFSKKEVEKQIEEFFKHLHDKTKGDVKKMKKLAMSHNIKLGDKKKLFCKHCLTPYKDPSIRIKNDYINITCEHCNNVNRWKFDGKIELNLPKSCDDEEACGC